MIKKLLTLFVFGVMVSNLQGQTIVSTTPENKKVILEEFTGINCVYCPDGHTIAQAIQNNNPGNVFLVNIHVGGFATPSGGQPDFRTPFGTAIANQSGLTGYPAGTVNRTVFSGMSQNGAGGTAMSRNFWTNASNQTLNQASYVNLGVEATIDVNTNQLTVHVEAYYTGNSPVSTNKLNVALLQNNTLGPQTGGGMGNNYNHTHRLVHMVTGQWGVDVNTTTTGSFVDQTFNYTIPNAYNGVPVELADLELVVFMTETTQVVISGNGAYPSYTGLTNANDAFLRYIVDIDDQCNELIAPKVNIQNMGQNPITTLDIDYTLNSGTTHTYTWTGNLTSLQNVTVELPEVAYSLQTNNILEVSLPNDDVNSNNEASSSFDMAVESLGALTLLIQTDNWGTEVRWNIKKPDGTTMYQGGPYGNNQTITVPITLFDDCYTFNLIDTFGDGGGPVSLTDSDGFVVYSTNGNYGSGESTPFSTTGNPLGVGENSLSQVVLYPNPSNGIFNLSSNNFVVEITVYDITGKKVYAQTGLSDNSLIDISFLQKGMYLAKISNENAEQIQKLIIK